MKVIRREVESKTDHLTILLIGDIHYGDSNCDLTILDNMIERLKTEPDTYCVLLGDLLNMATKNSISDAYSASCPPLSQVQDMAHKLKPVCDRILFAIDGNHENRVYRESGLRPTLLIMAQLGLEEYYSPEPVLLFLKTGRKEYSKHKDQRISYAIYGTHGSRGGRKAGGKANAIVDTTSIVAGADVFLMAHTHMPLVMRQSCFRPDHRHGSVEEIDQLLINTASSLQYGGYGSVQGYTPSSRKYPELWLDNHYKRAEAIL